MGKQSKIMAVNRQKNIVDYVNSHQTATVPELVQYCSVSPATIRNDLNELAGNGFLKRTHGGAVSLQSAVSTQNGMSWTEEINYNKSMVNREGKAAIAGKAVACIHEGDNIMLDAGTTTYQLAMLLGQFHNLNVITYDIDIAHYLIHNTHVNVYFAGGHVRADLFYCDSFETTDLLNRFKVSVSFVSANAISLTNGLTSSSPETTTSKRILIANSQRPILLADSSKLGKTGFFQFADISQIDTLITDSKADPAFVQEALARGLKVICE